MKLGTILSFISALFIPLVQKLNFEAKNLQITKHIQRTFESIRASSDDQVLKKIVFAWNMVLTAAHSGDCILALT